MFTLGERVFQCILSVLHIIDPVFALCYLFQVNLHLLYKFPMLNANSEAEVN